MGEPHSNTERTVDAAKRSTARVGLLRCVAGLGLLAVIFLSSHSQAQEMTWEYSVQVSAQIQTQPPSILLSWPQDVATLPDYYTVSRKDPSAPAWGAAVVLPGTRTNYLDTAVTAGIEYEYQIFKSTTNHVGYGYICAGIQLPMIENRGKIILLVDQTYAASLVSELTRLQQDLAGDGWVVLRHDVPEDLSVPAVKALIKGDYNADPINVNALFIFGHVPVPYSGDAAPDGHPVDHSGAWPADVFYGVMNGVWTDTTVNDVSASDSRNYNVPGDGKYDQSEIPGQVQLEIGRVDLADMPGFDTNGIATFRSEVELLRGYLNKDHNYRSKKFSLPARGLVFNATGDRQGEAFAADAWRNYAPLLGAPPAVSLGDNEFLPILRTNGYQWAYATSGADFIEMSSLGGTGLWYQSATYLDFVRADIQTAFTMLLGSWLGDWDNEDNLMRAVLATPTYGLSCVYAGRPHWYFHPMGMGETLGYCARLTQNNHANGLYRNESNNFAGFVHIALLGDPTLRLHTVSPPTGLHGFPVTQGIQLSWTPSAEDVAGYYVYRGAGTASPFVRITPSLVPTNSFLISSDLCGSCTYMVRAVKLENCPSGSYFNPSQGAFATLSDEPAVRGGLSGTNLNFTWLSLTGRVYRILWNNSLTSTNWSPLCGDLVATDGVMACTLSGAVSGNGWSFAPVSPPNVVWVDDALPAGAVPGADGGDSWNWVSNNPAPYSGSVASQSTNRPGMHEHYFTSATATLSVNTGDVLFAYVYLDPTNMPSEIMLQWSDGSSWEHRAFWGSDLIYFGNKGTPGHVSMGGLPPAGAWYSLQVPASLVGLGGGSMVSGIAFAEYNGRATWDYAGKYSPGLTNAAPSSLLGTFSQAVPQRFYKVLLLP